jgi:DNA-binding response OmpR family regulator
LTRNIIGQVLKRSSFEVVYLILGTPGSAVSFMKKILIVEDDLDIQDIFRIIFTSKGYEVECNDRGLPISERQRHLPDLIILDKKLPDISGVEACRILKSKNNTRHIPVILISAAPGIAADARVAGADDFMEKPFNMQMILKKVSKLFKQQHAHFEAND